MNKTITFPRNTSLRYTLLTVAAAASLALTGCGAAVDTGAAPSVSASSTAAALTISETWAKAIDSGMTSAFGIIRNTTDQDITVVGVSTPASKTAELHEVVAGTDGGMKMQAKKDGFSIPAHGELVLEPGAEHIMLMGLVKPVEAGDELPFSLELSNGQSLDFTAVVKDFSGANENYGDMDHGDGGHGDMDHGDGGHGDMDHGTPADAK